MIFPDAAWVKVEQCAIDRVTEESSGHFGKRVLELKPDLVVDLTCYTLESARQLVEALRGKISHFLHCGTIWVHGVSVEVPTTEDQPRFPIDDYGSKKAAIAAAKSRNACCCTICEPLCSQSCSARAAVSWRH